MFIYINLQNFYHPSLFFPNSLIEMSSHYYYSSNQNGFDPNSQDPAKIVDTFASSMRWAILSSIVLGLVSTVAVVAIIYAIIDCLKKTGSAIPAYARIASDEIAGKSTKSEGPSPLSDQHVGIAVEPEFPLIRDSQVEFATMERFLSEMARNQEMPVMLSLCGVEEKDKERAGRMSIVALLCIQHSPDARPLMSDVVKMLQGSMEIMREPENPFGYLESTRPNHAMETGSSGDMSSSISGTSGSQQSHSNHNLPGTVEIELACKY
ncbi:hypothetical protein DKX38_028283 [Salix brachista]|uniref:Uncharacterized protein n=1 Tax=Salix brachista TaxID=2182728 RepID=A0A5N5JGZ0_9ROSI|nr:hypothetical protein DKX38_028283 [Salix brachista]